LPIIFSINNLGKDTQKTLSLMEEILIFFNIRTFQGGGRAWGRSKIKCGVFVSACVLAKQLF